MTPKDRAWYRWRLPSRYTPAEVEWIIDNIAALRSGAACPWCPPFRYRFSIGDC